MRVALVVLLLSVLSGAQDSPAIIGRSQWGSNPGKLGPELLQQPHRIVIHHAGVVWKSDDEPYHKIRALQAWGQKEKGWPDLPYHYLIAPGGEIFEGRDWHYRPESNTSYDLEGVLNVELWGDFEQQKVTGPQLRSLVSLLVYLCKTHGLAASDILGHRDAAPGQTVCPGQDLYGYLQRGSLRGWVEQGLRGETPAVALGGPGGRSPAEDQLGGPGGRSPPKDQSQVYPADMGDEGVVGVVLQGDRVEQVMPASPAERAGLVAGDKVISIGGVPLAGATPAQSLALCRKTLGTRAVFQTARGPFELTWAAIPEATLARAQASVNQGASGWVERVRGQSIGILLESPLGRAVQPGARVALVPDQTVLGQARVTRVVSHFRLEARLDPGCPAQEGDRVVVLGAP